jgi:hypothetical protein
MGSKLSKLKIKWRGSQINVWIFQNKRIKLIAYFVKLEDQNCNSVKIKIS